MHKNSKWGRTCFRDVGLHHRHAKQNGVSIRLIGIECVGCGRRDRATVNDRPKSQPTANDEPMKRLVGLVKLLRHSREYTTQETKQSELMGRSYIESIHHGIQL